MNLELLLSDMKEVRSKWGWFLGFGISLILLGSAAIGAASLTTFASMIVLGWLVFLSGVCEIVTSFTARRWSGFFLHICAGVLAAVGGLFLLGYPLASVVAATILLGTLFLISGLFRITAAAVFRYPGWGWAIFDGAISLVLGGLIWSQWRLASLWLIGAIVGINLIFRGWAWIMFAVSARQLPKRVEELQQERQEEHITTGVG